MSGFQNSNKHGRSAFRWIASLIAIVSIPCALVGQVTKPMGDTSNGAKNLARMNRGAQIERVTPDGHVTTISSNRKGDSTAAALIMDDDTLGCPLEKGVTTFVVTLPGTYSLDRFTFVNENGAADGELKISVSNYRLPAASTKWAEVEGGVRFTNQRMFNLSMVGVEARYVRLVFNVVKGGQIAALGLYGAESLETFGDRHGRAIHIAYTSPSNRVEDMLNFNFANVYAKAHVVFVSSGTAPAARRMIDDDTQTAFRFAANDPHPTAIVQLADEQRLHRISALYKMQSGRLDVYLLDNLPANPADLSGLTPVASYTDHDKSGKAAVEFDPKGARYVALRWTADKSGSTAESFEIAELHAFGFVPLSMFQMNAASDVYASAENTIHLTGESSPDFSNSLGTLADPPHVAVISQ